MMRDIEIVSRLAKTFELTEALLFYVLLEVCKDNNHCLSHCFLFVHSLL